MSIIYCRHVTSSDLSKKAWFLSECLSIFLQLVVDMTLLHPISNPSRKNTYIHIHISCDYCWKVKTVYSQVIICNNSCYFECW